MPWPLLVCWNCSEGQIGRKTKRWITLAVTLWAFTSCKGNLQGIAILRSVDWRFKRDISVNCAGIVRRRYMGFEQEQIHCLYHITVKPVAKNAPILWRNYLLLPCAKSCGLLLLKAFCLWLLLASASLQKASFYSVKGCLS